MSAILWTSAHKDLQETKEEAHSFRSFYSYIFFIPLSSYSSSIFHFLFPSSSLSPAALALFTVKN